MSAAERWRGRASEHERVSELLAAWSLDACTVDEEALVEAHLLGCDECAAEAGQFREVAGRLGSSVAAPPPPGLRAKVLAAAFARRPPVALPPLVVPYAAEVGKLDELLGALSTAQWAATTPVKGWTVHELVAHIAALDGLLAAQLNLPIAFPHARGTLREASAAAQEQARSQTPDATRAAWRAQADRIVDRVRELGVEVGDQTVEEAGLAWPLDLQLLARAFETWIHADDIRKTIGAAPQPPPPEQLNLLAGGVVRLLPGALAESGRAHPGRSARLVLDGDGGGEWALPMGLGRPDGVASPGVTVRLDLMEFCYLVGGRRNPALVEYEAVGDRRLADDLIAAAAAFDRD